MLCITSHDANNTKMKDFCDTYRQSKKNKREKQNPIPTKPNVLFVLCFFDTFCFFFFFPTPELLPISQDFTEMGKQHVRKQKREEKTKKAKKFVKRDKRTKGRKKRKTRKRKEGKKVKECQTTVVIHRKNGKRIVKLLEKYGIRFRRGGNETKYDERKRQ